MWFPANFAKFLGTPFLKEHFQWLLLHERNLNMEMIENISFIDEFKINNILLEPVEGITLGISISFGPMFL